jgi:hypothetical protein
MRQWRPTAHVQIPTLDCLSSPQGRIVIVFLAAGVVAGRRRPTRIQTAESQDTQLDDFALFAVQSRLGLDHTDTGDVHCDIHALRRCFFTERARQQQEKQKVRRGPHRYHRPDR